MVPSEIMKITNLRINTFDTLFEVVVKHDLTQTENEIMAV
jgi:hypothetical protein